jgi:hypothetical protein
VSWLWSQHRTRLYFELEIEDRGHCRRKRGAGKEGCVDWVILSYLGYTASTSADSKTK